jgi:hypothetical protein
LLTLNQLYPHIDFFDNLTVRNNSTIARNEINVIDQIVSHAEHLITEGLILRFMRCTDFLINNSCKVL